MLNGITETVKNEVKEQKGGLLSMLLGTLGASLLGDLLTKNLSGRGVIRAGDTSLLRYKPIIKMNLDLLASIVEIIYPIK